MSVDTVTFTLPTDVAADILVLCDGLIQNDETEWFWPAAVKVQEAMREVTATPDYQAARDRVTDRLYAAEG